MQGSVATAVRSPVQMDRRQFLKPDSALVRTALEMMAKHVAAGAEGEPAPCEFCGLSFPCPTVIHARQVASAGGMLRASDRSVERAPAVVAEDAVAKDAVAKDAMAVDAMAKDATAKDAMAVDAMAEDGMAKDETDAVVEPVPDVAVEGASEVTAGPVPDTPTESVPGEAKTDGPVDSREPVGAA
ncbi:hypothetical protein HC028_11125 [Planosporangium flavigriseum]|nr:pentapeptide MXKDX repeat protein [Planosporangium flavigriseum]NJC65052.1 hypothetical protein [Planosporangium flavigriseum]